MIVKVFGKHSQWFTMLELANGKYKYPKAQINRDSFLVYGWTSFTVHFNRSSRLELNLADYFNIIENVLKYKTILHLRIFW